MNSISISKRLLLLVAALLGLLVLAVAGAMWQLKQANVRMGSVYSDRLVPVKQLGRVGAAYAVGIVDAAHKVRDGIVTPPAGLKLVQDAKLEIAREWQAYLATELTPEEQQLIDKAKRAFKPADAATDKLIELMRSGDTVAVGRFAAQEMYPAIDPVAEQVAALTDLQLNVAEADYKASQASYSAMLWGSLVVVGLTLMGASWLAWVIVRSITRPLMAAVSLAETVAAGDLRQQIEVAGSDETAQLLMSLSRMNHSLADIVRQVRDSADSIAAGSTQIANGSLNLSQRTEQQASSLEETAASMEQLTSTVKQNSTTSTEATRLAADASTAAGRGGQVVHEVVSTMSQITEQSRKIGDIIGVIDGIAFQTNILALNAAVEAARAGEQGRGFAVVASEVRALASRSADAAKQIKALIGASVERVELGAGQVAEAGRTMGDIVRQVQNVSSLISEISLASREQSQGIDQVSDAVMQMDQVTQQNAALVEESAAAADSLQQQAQVLARTVAIFKL